MTAFDLDIRITAALIAGILIGWGYGRARLLLMYFHWLDRGRPRS